MIGNEGEKEERHRGQGEIIPRIEIKDWGEKGGGGGYLLKKHRRSRLEIKYTAQACM